MILFIPFRNEAGLILDEETVEEAFQRHRNDNDSLKVLSQQALIKQPITVHLELYLFNRFILFYCT